jgi:hypothetical protein
VKAAKGEMSDVSLKVWCDLCSLRIAPYEARVITHVGGNLLNSQHIETSIAKLILQDPDGAELKLLANSVSDRDEAELRGQIKLALGVAKRVGVAVKTFDGPLTSVIFRTARKWNRMGAG